MAFLARNLGILVWLDIVQAAPTQNLTALRTETAPSWVSDPDDRGTWSLLYSCIFTLALCVWTAVHPNVPSQDFQRGPGKYGKKLLFVLFAMLAPEYGVCVAFTQFQRARSLAQELSELRTRHAQKIPYIPISSAPDHLTRTKTDPSVPKTYSIVYGFYVHMGGLAVNVSPIHDRLQTMLLTPLGLLHLAKKGHFIDVSDYDIKDKSKANVLAKGLVLLQIAWSMLQCFSRKATGLPISLLEVHTLVHAGCAVVMYGLWFHKPMDVEEPIVISTAEFASEIALMLVRNQGSGVQPVGNLVIPTQFKSACYQGPTYRAWPGRQAAEASYLVFDPSKGQRSESLSDADNTPVTHTTGLGEGQQAPKQEGLRDNNCSLEDQHPTAAESHVSSPKNPSNPIQEAACVSTISGTTFSQEQAKAVSASIENQGDRLLNYFNPGYNERRKARYQHKSPRLLDPGLPKEVNGCDVWTGFHSTPPRGVPTQLAVFTGDTGPGGIGPNAFMIGSWKGQTDQGLNKDRIAVLEVPETLRRWLPPGKLRRSSISFCCLLKISLSRKDIHRWELAGTALYDEHRTANARVHEVQRFVDISGPVGSSHHAYFVSHTASTASSVLEEMYAVDPGEADRPVLVLQGIYRRLANNVGFRWTSTLAALVTTAFLYAALHLALWNYQFPTTAEKLLWRISASTLLAIPTLLFSGLCTSAMYKRIAAIVLVAQSKRRAKQQRTPDRRPGSINCPPVAVPNLNINAEEAPTTAPTSNENDDIHSDFRYPTDTESILVALGAFGVYLVALLYLLARSFIIVESFLSLRHVPIGVYAGVGWSKYIPHL